MHSTRRTVFFARWLAAMLLGWIAVATASAGRVERLDAGWRFHLGECENGAAVDCDDATWQPVRLPHDWAAAGPFNPNDSGRTGKLPWRGVGWYRRAISLDTSDRGKRVYLDFDGVMASPRVFVNGQLAGQWDYGYMSFRVDATPFVRFGQTNVVAVRADTTGHGSRWYPGAGLYRKVRLVICEPMHVAHWGIHITTPQITDAAAVVRVQTEVLNHTDAQQPTRVTTTIIDPNGRVVAEGTSPPQTLAANQGGHFDQRLTVAHPQRWDIRTPRLYTARIQVRRSGRPGDTDSATFGIRTAEFKADSGFYLNGRRLGLHGVDLHHDQGPLGAALFARSVQRQLRIMKDMGANAVRTSHNPPAPDLLEACDRMGLVVFDECFDKWDSTADRRDQPFEPFMARQVRNFVRRDRNHPCVVVWSIGNEMGGLESNRGGKAPEQVAFMVHQFKKHDPVRPVTLGCLWPPALRADNHVLDALDITSWNYGRKYLRARERYPDKPIIYSESASAVSSRGEYELPHPRAKDDFSQRICQVDSYDLNAAWGPRDIPDVDLRRMELDRYVAGEFVWTGFDYLGEPTPYQQQARSSYFGIVDLCGIPKDRYFLYRSQWRPDVTTIHILPHWNWPDRIGKTVPVYVYTHGDSAELFLNGKSLGRRTKMTDDRPWPEPPNLAAGCPTQASSQDKRCPARNGNDGKAETRWSAGDDSADQWWQVDLRRVQTIRSARIVFDRSAMNYRFVLEASTQGRHWQTLSAKQDWGRSRESEWTFHFDAEARYVRLRFTGLNKCRAALRELTVHAQPWGGKNGGGLGPYYRIVDRYRLRWENVVYQPGELKAVAYQNGHTIGEARMRTADSPARIRLTPERSAVDADGQDLAYVLVEAVDAQGTVCPKDDRMIRFAITGPATIAGIGNGNPLGLDRFQDARHPLFNGKAMLILRTSAGRPGPIRITAEADGLKPATTTITSR